MEGWQIDIIKVSVSAIISGTGGAWAYWAFTRKARLEAELAQQHREAEYEQTLREAELREQQRQAEYDDFKKKRRLVGAGEVERVARADQLADLIIKLKTHQISQDEFNAFKDNLVTGRKPRVERQGRGSSIHIGEKAVIGDIATAAAASEVARAKLKLSITPVVTASDDDHDLLVALIEKRMANVWKAGPDKWRQFSIRMAIKDLLFAGPNNGAVGYDGDGNKVEWLPSEDEPGQFWPMILMRSADEIQNAAVEFFDKVWWNRHQNWLYAIETGEEPLKEDQKGILETAKRKAKELEDKYGRENLGWNDFEWGMINGKLSAIRWVLGAEWDFLDT